MTSYKLLSMNLTYSDYQRFIIHSDAHDLNDDIKRCNVVLAIITGIHALVVTYLLSLLSYD